MAIILIIFASTLVRSTFGFGNALIAMPLIALFMDMKATTPLVALVGFIIALSILASNWRKAQVKSAWRLIVSSIAGIPTGLLFLKGGNEAIVKCILAGLIISFSLYNLFKPKLFTLATDKAAYIFGFGADILGGAYNTDGPPIVIYGTLRRWQPAEFRATLQGYFLPASLCIITGHGLSGLWTALVLKYFLISLPFVILAIVLGGWLNKILEADKFVKYIYIFLIIIGCYFLYGIFQP